MFWLRTWILHAYLMSDGSCSSDHTRIIWIHFLFGRIVCRITPERGKNCHKLHCFGSFAGARAYHQGPRWLKPCHFQRTVYWHCECDKPWSDAWLQLPYPWTKTCQYHRAKEPSLARLQLANMKVSMNDESNWKTFSVFLKPGQRLIKNISHAISLR